MNKTRFRLLSIALVIAILGNVFAGCSSRQRIPLNVTEKVRFEGIGEITTESSSEIAKLINADSINQTTIMIELDNHYDGCIAFPDDEDITLEEAQALLKQQRENVKSFYSHTNEAIMESLDLSGFDIEFRIDKYAPFIIGEFSRELTSEDVDKIYALAETEEISVIYVKNEQMVESEITDALDAIGASSIITNSYNLYLYDNNGNIVASSEETHNNEFIEYISPVTGYYSIKIKQNAAKKTTMTDYCSYSFLIDRF